ncbi:MAG: DUF6576 domain-containing protein [Verrucomicrobiales bacterium]
MNFQSPSYSPYNLQPIMHIGQMPVYGVTLLVGLNLLSLVVWAFMSAAGADELARNLVFTSAQTVGENQWWRPITYGLVNDIRVIEPIWFLIMLFFFYFFGMELERILGRGSLFILYGMLWLCVPLSFSLTHIFGEGALAGTRWVHIGAFVAFSTLMPTVRLLFGIEARWFAIALISIHALQYIAVWQPVYLVALGVLCATAIFGSRWLAGKSGLDEWIDTMKERMSESRSRRKLRVLPKPEADLPKKRATKKSKIDHSVDAILDKIAQHGMNSLTPEERAKLEQARSQLLEKDDPA